MTTRWRPRRGRMAASRLTHSDLVREDEWLRTMRVSILSRTPRVCVLARYNVVDPTTSGKVACTITCTQSHVCSSEDLLKYNNDRSCAVLILSRSLFVYLPSPDWINLGQRYFPSWIIDATGQVLKQTLPNRHSHPKGRIHLRQTIKNFYEASFKRSLDVETEIIVTSGANEGAVFDTLSANCS